MRLFAAAIIDLPPGLTDRLNRCAGEALGPAAKAVRPANMHLTMAFLGEAPPARAAAAADCLEVLSGSGIFGARFGPAGVFPSPASPRVFWVGFSSGADELKAAADRLAGSLRGAGFKLEEREFHPHLTLARFRSGVPAQVLKKAAASVEAECAGVLCPVKGVALYSSTQVAGGPKYRQLARVDFKKNG